MNIRTIMFLMAAVALGLGAGRWAFSWYGYEGMVMTLVCAIAPALAAVGWFRSAGTARGAVVWTVAGPIVLTLAVTGFMLIIFSESRTFSAAAMIVPLVFAVAGGWTSRRRVKGALTGAVFGMSAQVAVSLAVIFVGSYFDTTPGPRLGVPFWGFIWTFVVVCALWVPVAAIIGVLVAKSLRLLNGGPPRPARLSRSQLAAMESLAEVNDD
jgi:hypothetical protein